MTNAPIMVPLAWIPIASLFGMGLGILLGWYNR